DRFPEPRAQWEDASATGEMELLQEIVVAARNIRAEMKLDPKRKVAADFSSADPAIRKLVEENLDALQRLAALSRLEIAAGHLDSSGAALRSTAQFDLRIAYADATDKQAEISRLKKEIERLAKDIESKQARLADESFITKAPARVVENLRITLLERRIEHQKLLDRLQQLES
ncbi:MAG: hypothetical protein WB716_02160, partial [Candidatus Acidiferrales bacterium]